MDKDELKDRIFRARKQIGSNISNVLDDLSFAEKCEKARLFFKKHGHEAWQKFKTLPKDIRRNILIAAIVSSTVGAISITAVHEFAQNKEKREIIKRNNEAKEKTNATYKITDQASFQTLYQDALPLMAVSMFPSECLVLNPYADNKTGVNNTIGLGSFWYPQNGDPKSKDWVKASDYFKGAPHHSISGEHAFDLVDGWYRYREGGRIYKNLFKYLQGVILKPNEFAAIATVMYNNEKKGAELCQYVAKHYNDPVKCAQKIASFRAPDGFSGIDKRHLHEAYLYLNYDNYVQNLYNLQVRRGVNSKGEPYIITSVTQLSAKDVQKGRTAILSGKKAQIIDAQNDIIKYINKNGVSVRYMIENNILTPELQKELCLYGIMPVISFSLDEAKKNPLAYSPDQIYKEALKYYTKGTTLEKEEKHSKAHKEFSKALETFQELIKNGYKGADLYNDVAITYFHLGEYNKCIDMSKLVLNTGEEAAYSSANYNAALAYEKLGNSSRAILNYEAAMAHGANKDTCQSAIDRIKQNTTHSQISQPNTR